MNPFLEKYKLQLIEQSNTYCITKDYESDVNYIEEEITEIDYISNHNSTSLYLTDDIIKLLFIKLDNNSRTLLLYIMANLKENSDIINLNPITLEVMVNINNDILYESIKQLEENDIILFKDKTIYWINPYYLYNGNRLGIYKTDNIIITDTITNNYN
jgi:hypothetical protein